MKWQEMLTDIFAASINQQTLDDGADEMVLVSEKDPKLHQAYLTSIDCGIVAAQSGDTSVVAIVNRSGYRASTPEEAVELLNRLRKTYLHKYATASGDNGDERSAS